MAQTWEKLLFSSGGALRPSKCYWFAITWQWAKRFLIMRSKGKYTNKLDLNDSTSGNDVMINTKSHSESE